MYYTTIFCKRYFGKVKGVCKDWVLLLTFLGVTIGYIGQYFLFLGNAYKKFKGEVQLILKFMDGKIDV